MQKLQESHVFNGLQRDLSVSKHPASFLYDAHNIRLTAKEGDTLLTITNERGPLDMHVGVTGTYLGHCLIGKYLVVFSTVTVAETEKFLLNPIPLNVLDSPILNPSDGNNDKTDSDSEAIVDPWEGDDTSIDDREKFSDDTILPWNPDDKFDDGFINYKDDKPYIDDEPHIEEPEKVKTDYITRIDLESGNKTVLYLGNLNFSVQYPIEAIASYENESILKVYWIDGNNLPRVINIVGTIKNNLDSQFDFVRELQLNEKVTIQKLLGAAGVFAPGVIQYAFTYFSKYGQESNIFYTSPLLYISYKDRGGSPEDKIENAFKITVSDLDGNFDYLRIYSILRTSINATPIVKRVQDIGIKNLTPDVTSRDSVVSSILPTVYIDDTYKSVVSTRQYYKQKTLLDSTQYWYGFSKSRYPSLRIKTSGGYVTWGQNSTDSSVLWISTNFINYNSTNGYQVVETTAHEEVTMESLYYSAEEPLFNAVSFLDTGTSGDLLDPTELLYKGGETIIANTIELKDNTLFFGNIGLTRPQITYNLQKDIKSNTEISLSTRKIYATSVFTSNYIYANQLTAFDSEGKINSVPCGGFKRGDYYRCGIQFQHKSGKWSDPIFIKDEVIANKPTTENKDTTIKLPALTGTLGKAVTESLTEMGYKKARAVVVFPDIQDRVTICQGVACPTMYTTSTRDNNSPYAQSSWFFRPILGSDVAAIMENGAVAPTSEHALPYTNRNSWNPEHMRQVEIQGYFGDALNLVDTTKTENIFGIDSNFLTFHSPDIEFNDYLPALDFVDAYYRKVGYVNFVATFSDIDILTETPTISNGGGGFQHKSFITQGPQGIISGLFYDDYLVDDESGDDMKIRVWPKEKSAYKWMVYAWHKTGSLNNDINRPADKGTRTAMLKKKVISNLRYAYTKLADSVLNVDSASLLDGPLIFNSDQCTIVKVGNNVYLGNIDTLLSPIGTDGTYFAFDDSNPTKANINTLFNSTKWWKTFNESDTLDENPGIYSWEEETNWKRYKNEKVAGDKYASLAVQRESVRMKYKSTPHMVFSATLDDVKVGDNESVLPILEIIRRGDKDDSFYRSTMFGGDTEDALKANIWIPCGEPVILGKSYDGTLTNGATKIQYSYGDTYYQRWDCLKTYPFTHEDINQIVEIGSFMLETRTNIDGRYDRNRGQTNNLNMTPQNFNLFNPVYNQIDNFFTYRILDEDYYNINSFPNQVTWTKEKQAGADVDLWTNITLASTYDMDGSKGAVTSLNTWKDQIYCFQDKGISNILFNSRVQIPTSDGVPIEISNSYKVDGYRYISDGVGCTNKWTISNTPSGLYFMDSISNHLYHIGDGIQDISTTHNMTSWFNKNNSIIKSLYDNVNHDLYLLTDTEALCYSETLGQFTSFMDYGGISLIESHNNYVYTMKDSKLYSMFKGQYCNFFGTKKGWDFTFISNGVSDNTVNLNKVFTNLEFRANVSGDGILSSNNKFTPVLPFDSIEVWNEYQHGQAALRRLTGHNSMIHPNEGNSSLKRKFRIWRCDIPRNNYELLTYPTKSEEETDAEYRARIDAYNTWYKGEVEKGISRYVRKPNDRMTNPWIYINLKKEASTTGNLRKTEIHDIQVSYFV